ncbi:MAG: hypothetical protein K8T91_17155 [Planctomycetes bacterium]|nr:hypothetical protein [Planctomycetota bacterium]
MSKGPVHEAFAEPVVFDTKAVPEVITKAPPEAIEEIPPEVRPEGRNVQWIPGYWNWDNERSDFIWVSGVWRDAPPGQRWIPGNWATVDGGYQWTSGVWVDENTESLTYLPHPPETLDEGPTSEVPDGNYFWVPGGWNWTQDRYAWRPGYWSRGYEGWVWMPSRYMYTPRGSIYSAGYWDYPLGRRGWLFAPVAFRGGYYNQGYYYTPSSIVDAALLTASLFVNPYGRHYFYGDYYGRRGYQPWFAYHMNRRGYDPFFAYDSWRIGSRHQDWYGKLYRNYRTDLDGRGDRNRGDIGDGRRHQDIAADINRYRRELGEPELNARTSAVRSLDKMIEERRDDRNIVRLDDAQRRAAVSGAQRYRSLAQGRLEGEAKDRSDIRAQQESRGPEGRRAEASVQNYQPRQFRLPQRQPVERTAQPGGREGDQRQVQRPLVTPRGNDRESGSQPRRYETLRPPSRGGEIERGGERSGDRVGSDRGGAGRSTDRGANVERGNIQRGDGDRGSGGDRGGATHGGDGGSRGGESRGGGDRGGGGGGNRGGRR